MITHAEAGRSIVFLQGRRQAMMAASRRATAVLLESGRLPAVVALSALGLLLLAGLAFWPPYLARLPTASPYAHVHALLGSAWLLLLVAQPLLLKAGRRPLHRVLGRAGVGVGTAFVISSVLLAHHALRRLNAEAFAAEGRYVYLPLAMALLFAAALALAWRWRRVPAAHGRFMACTLLPLLDPVFARLLYFHGPTLPAGWLHQVPAFGTIALVLMVLRRGWPAERPGRTSLDGYMLLCGATLAGFFVVPDLMAWQALVAWIRGLPLT